MHVIGPRNGIGILNELAQTSLTRPVGSRIIVSIVRVRHHIEREPEIHTDNARGCYVDQGQVLGSRWERIPHIQGGRNSITHPTIHPTKTRARVAANERRTYAQ